MLLFHNASSYGESIVLRGIVTCGFVQNFENACLKEANTTSHNITLDFFGNGLSQLLRNECIHSFLKAILFTIRQGGLRILYILHHVLALTESAQL